MRPRCALRAHVRTIGSRVRRPPPDLPAMCNQDVASDTLLAVLEQLAVLPLPQRTPLTGSRIAQLGLWSSVEACTVLWLRAAPSSVRLVPGGDNPHSPQRVKRWDDISGNGNHVTSFSFDRMPDFVRFVLPAASAALPLPRSVCRVHCRCSTRPESPLCSQKRREQLPLSRTHAEPIVLPHPHPHPLSHLPTHPHPHPRRCQIPWDVRGARSTLEARG